MPTEIETISKWESGWTFRLRPAATTPPEHLIVFVHGWTGDEYAMQLFSRQVSSRDALIFPRGPVKAFPSGFGWADHTAEGGTSFAQFAPAAHGLIKLLESQAAELGIPDTPMTLVGFSQGAALTLTLAALYSEKISRLASLAGFLPQEMPPELSSEFKGKQMYIAHGRSDRAVPIQEAHRLVAYLENADATVKYCESNTGHKLSALCFKELANFLNPD